MKIIGVLKFEDGGDMDHKIIGVVADDRQTNDAVTSLLDDLTPGLKTRSNIILHTIKTFNEPGYHKSSGLGRYCRRQTNH